MCLILFAVDADAEHHLVVAANRDEFHARASKPAAYWSDHDQVLGGLDLEAGGTWLGITTEGRFAAVTNFAEGQAGKTAPLSRGKLTRDFLTGKTSPEVYLAEIDKQRDQFKGFNLLLSDGKQCFYYSNRKPQIQKLAPGYYGLSNQLLDCDWPKVEAGRDQIQASDRSVESLFDLLAYRGDRAHHSARFIVGETYGTRTSTVVHIRGEEIGFSERNFDAQCNRVSESSYKIERTIA